MRRLRTRLVGALPAVLTLTTATPAASASASGGTADRRSERRISAVRKEVPGVREKPRVAFPYLRGSASGYRRVVSVPRSVVEQLHKDGAA